VALGGKADWFVADHALSYGYGEHSPFAKLVAAHGKTLLIGAPPDTMTLLHHAEHLAKIPGKRLKRHLVPIRDGNETTWRDVEEFETDEPVVAGLADDYFADIVGAFLAEGRGTEGTIGNAPSVLVDAEPVVRFAVDWLQQRFR
jgi:aminoglycoside 3-N-acetyltransferase